ncbi:hypothetical protein CF165_02295 [Amycolatopsis vastitatis]|uniref:Serine/threonine protein kinase n=1 Tax=Amycolatopsis vastitatis TaxID=1905142 RepID=A0A229TJN3_9PSEU|nr:hypothetical protein CF165_02295 [Amycolatopsis vastitatis]
MSRFAGIVSAGALITFAAAPAALAQTETETTTVPPTSETTSSEATTTAPTASETPTTPVTTTGTTSADPTSVVTTTTTTASAPTSTSADSEPPKDDYQDNTGHGFVGPGGEGVLVIACASGKIGPVSTQYLSVTGGPDQDESDGRYWNYTVRVVDAPAGTTTAKFSWTCDGVEGNGIVEFQQEQPPATSTSPSTSTSASTTTSTESSSTAPITTATSSSAAAAAGNSAPKAQVKVAPKGGVETGFGGMAG